MHAIESYTVQNIDKNSYAMHTIKITPDLFFEYQCTTGKFIRLPNRIESNRNFFCPNWNALLSRRVFQGERKRERNGSTWSSVGNGVPANSHTYYY